MKEIMKEILKEQEEQKKKGIILPTASVGNTNSVKPPVLADNSVMSVSLESGGMLTERDKVAEEVDV